MLNEPLYGPQFGSYHKNDVAWLLKDLSNYTLEAPLEEREESIQHGQSHYAESLPIEYVPSDEYTQLFYESLEKNKTKLAYAIGIVAERIYELRNHEPVLVSLARAGTPIGILIKRYLEEFYSLSVPHYAISIVRGKGIDTNALQYIAQHHDPSRVMFIDGWTGKGAITKELHNALELFAQDYKIRFNNDLAVLSDPGSSVAIYGTREDYLIPSACLNSTVSGLVSRTVLNDNFIKDNDYHGAKFYREYNDKDVSQLFIDSIVECFTSDMHSMVLERYSSMVFEEPDWSGWKTIESISEEYGIDNINLIKPGVGETTRVLLRRVPWRVLIRLHNKNDLKHVLLLCEQRNVEVIEKDDLPYACIGIIKPQKDQGEQS